MANILRFDVPHPADGRRWFVGLLVSSRCTEVTAALIGASGAGLDARVDVAGALSVAIPREAATLINTAAGADSIPAGALSDYRSLLAETQAVLVADLLAAEGIAPSRILAAAVHDPGLWRFERNKPRSYLGLCDAARLAEATGFNVIDAFPARDLAQGGQGGPIAAVAEWVLLKEPNQRRLLLDLGRTVRMTYLPAAAADAASRILAFDVGPGTLLLDLLAQRLSGGEEHFDPGGRLAVQGRRISELIEHWLRDPYFDRPLPRWHPRGVLPERFLTDALQLAVQHDWSVRDLLCSATHFIAETVAWALRKRLPDDAAIDEIVVVGGGQHNGMLLREIGRLTRLPLRRIGELRGSPSAAERGQPRGAQSAGWIEGPVRPSPAESSNNPTEAFGSASVAVLAMLYLDQVPANHPAITGTEVPRLLGRLTPGSPQNWRRLLQISAEASPTIRPLRAAL
jgi:anhydro-N-acetylmuramic acid kinase